MLQHQLIFFNNTLFVGLLKEDSVMVLGLGHSFCYRLVFHSLEFKRFFSFSSVLVSLEFCILRLFFFKFLDLVLLCYSSFMPTLFLVSSLSLCSIWFPCPFMLIHLCSCVKFMCLSLGLSLCCFLFYFDSLLTDVEFSFASPVSSVRFFSAVFPRVSSLL